MAQGQCFFGQRADPGAEPGRQGRGREDGGKQAYRQAVVSPWSSLAGVYPVHCRSNLHLAESLWIVEALATRTGQGQGQLRPFTERLTRAVPIRTLPAESLRRATRRGNRP